MVTHLRQVQDWKLKRNLTSGLPINKELFSIVIWQAKKVSRFHLLLAFVQIGIRANSPNVWPVRGKDQAGERIADGQNFACMADCPGLLRGCSSGQVRAT